MRPQEQKPKIFGIGLNKTGTTTLGEMGKILGLQCTSCNKRLLEDVVLRGDFERVKELVQKFDLFEEFEFVKFNLRAGMKSSRCSKFDV